MTVATSVKLSDETGAKLERLAARTGRSKSYYLREAVETHIDQLVRDYMNAAPPIPPAPLPGNIEDPNIAVPVQTKPTMSIRKGQPGK